MAKFTRILHQKPNPPSGYPLVKVPFGFQGFVHSCVHVCRPSLITLSLYLLIMMEKAFASQKADFVSNFSLTMHMDTFIGIYIYIFFLTLVI